MRLPAGLVARIEHAGWFTTTTRPYLILDTDLRIQAVNAPHEAATGRPPEDLLGEEIFDAFPDNPTDPHDGVANLAGSLERVLRLGKRDWMGVQRYDVPDPAVDGSFRHKIWVPVNTPLVHDGRVVGAIHHVQDVTDVLHHRRGLSTLELGLTTHLLAVRFPALDHKQVRGVLAHSHRVVTQALSRTDHERAAELATLRLEILAGHPAIDSPA